MATNLTVQSANVNVGWAMTNDDNIGGKTTNSGTLAWQLGAALTNGTGAGKARYIYVWTGTIAGAATQDFDLAGALTDFFGNTITFAKVKGIVLTHSSSTTATSVSLDGSVTNAFKTYLGGTNPTVKVNNGYSFALMGSDATGYAVTAGTGDVLRVLNNDGTNTATVSLVVYGE
jgi:hypothetical protein